MGESSARHGPELRDVLSILENSIQVLGHSAVLATLRNGSPPEGTRLALLESGLTPHQDLVDLYSWHDGSSDDPVRRLGDMYLLPGFFLLSLSEALRNYQTFLPDPRWRRGWMPLFANGGGDFIVMDLSREAAAPIRRFLLEEVESCIQYQDLRGMMTTINEAYRQGVFFLDGEGYLEMDDENYASLAAHLNPSVDWWK